MTIRIRVFCLLMIGLYLLPSAVCFACTCMSPREAKTMRDMAASRSEGAGASKVIFEGMVEKQQVVSGPIGAPSNAMSMTGYGAHRIVAMTVSRAYRGETERRVTILTGMGEGDCGFDFETGNEYLVYADIIEGGSLFTSICTGTAPIEQSAVALRLLRGEAPLAHDLLDPESYERKYEPQWTAKVCGRITKPDGSPLGEAVVAMSQVREEPFPPRAAEDPNLSKPDGSFCIEHVNPGKYLLTAEDTDFDSGNRSMGHYPDDASHGSGTRWMGYYPSVTKHSEATPIEVKAGDKLSGLHFGVQKQSLYTVRFRIITPDGSPVPWRSLGVAIDSPDRDRLAYHERHGVKPDGSCTLGLIPPGHYLVKSFIEPDFGTGQMPVEASKWQMAKQEVEINGDTVVVLKLVSAEIR